MFYVHTLPFGLLYKKITKKYLSWEFSPAFIKKEDSTNEKNISTEQNQEGSNAWLSFKNADKGGTKHIKTPQG